ncbi:MAG: 2-C-methyl-D-erythritol 2,4-cyclodiphosphate synthase [Myxococcales bacterium]|jgi:2-C-methyl-D-erythritol 2,4-cyclodiphosphate synthase|nr:2-C-methyl-D-erythritol 2,4-cyclodiphosphate synthase [Myxococcales bacterium]
MNFRVGIGYDIHRLKPGIKLVLGGVEIPFEMGLDAHSDGDALLHAICDAILGAASMGDIGLHFPDTDKKFKGADSAKLAMDVVRMAKDAGWRIVNIDSNIIAQRPKMRPAIEDVRKSISKIFGIELDSVSVKARTNEGLDAVGREEGIAVQAVVMLTK